MRNGIRNVVKNASRFLTETIIFGELDCPLRCSQIHDKVVFLAKSSRHVKVKTKNKKKLCIMTLNKKQFE